MITTIDSNEYVGRICIGKIERGVIKRNQNVTILHRDGSSHNVKVSGLYVYDGLTRVEVEEAKLGDIVAVSGLGEVNIGETIADSATPEAFNCRHRWAYQ